MTPTPYVADPDLTLYNGDSLEVLRELPDASVDCVITSPPYWGLRDYGIEGQIGLEETPDLYVERMVAVFREVRRVLADHGTCWVNMGDSYAGNNGFRPDAPSNKRRAESIGAMDGKLRVSARIAEGQPAGWRTLENTPGLKPKDLVGIPWRLAFALQADGWYLRADIIWSKPNPMPESVTDRPTKSHEYVFLFSKQPRYFFDQEAVREQFEARPQQRLTATKDQPLGPARIAVGIQQGNVQGGTHASRFAVQRETLRVDCGCAEAGCGRSFDECDCGCACHAGESRGPDGRRKTTVQGQDGSLQHRDGERWPNGGRNIRSVWEIATQPYSEAHFATYPEELVRRCLLAGCPEWVCRECGKPRERIVERERPEARSARVERLARIQTERGQPEGHGGGTGSTTFGIPASDLPAPQTLGFTDCGHNAYRPGIVLDPFGGSGTTALGARKHGRHSLLIELNEDYCAMTAKRLSQLSLFAEEAPA